jgi:hypothetical protein
MSASAQFTSEQLTEIIEDNRKSDQGAREVQKQVDGKEDLNPANTCSTLNTVRITINNKFEHECHDEAVRLQNSQLICQSIDDHVPGHEYSIQGLPGTKFLAHHI